MSFQKQALLCRKEQFGMKLTIRALAVILVLLMTLTVVACNNNGDKDNPSKDTPKETEKNTEKETEPELTDEEIEQLKMDMAASILEELAKKEQNTTGGNGSNKPGKEENTTN